MIDDASALPATVRERSMMWRAAILVASLIGLAVALAALDRVAFRSVATLLARLGWQGLVAYAAYGLVVFATLGAAWLVAMGERWRELVAFTWARMVREAASDLLPFAQVGGMVVGADVLIVRGVPGPRVYAGMAADLTTEMASQALFTGFGLWWTTSVVLASPDAWLETALPAGCAAIAALAIASRLAPRWLPRIVPSLLARVMPRSVEAIHQVAFHLGAMYARHRRMAAATVLNFAAWTLSAAGAWLVLRGCGVDLPIGRVLALEAIVFALRSVAFMVPGGLGIQEAGYALLAPTFGLPLDAAAALAIAKRAKDLGLGVPTLIAWQWIELRRVVLTRGRRSASTSRGEGP